MPEKLFKNRIGNILHYDPYNFDAEAGDKMVDSEGKLFRLVESSGFQKRKSGELTPVRIYPPIPEAKAIIRNKQIWWVW